MPNPERRKSTKTEREHSISVGKSSSQERILKKRGYTLGRLLGEGSYAKVYLADYEDQKTGKKQKLACKLINGTSAPKDFLRKFFPREVEIMSKVIHQYIIRVHSILQRKQKYYIFMQYAEMGDLLEFIRANGPVRERQARVWFAQVIKGLKYLHDRDISHRDMKCENLLLTSAYNIKISDFGFARYTVDDNGKPIMSETFCGSVSYAPPEIIKGQPYDCKHADLWSIGVVLYIMLNKSMPFDDSNLRKLYEAQKNRTWKVRSKLKDVLSTDVKQFLYVLLEPIPERRKSVDQLWAYPWVQNSSSPDVSVKPISPVMTLNSQDGSKTTEIPTHTKVTPPHLTKPEVKSTSDESPAVEPQNSYTPASPKGSAGSVHDLTRDKSGVIIENPGNHEGYASPDIVDRKETYVVPLEDHPEERNLSSETKVEKSVESHNVED